MTAGHVIDAVISSLLEWWLFIYLYRRWFEDEQ